MFSLRLNKNCLQLLDSINRRVSICARFIYAVNNFVNIVVASAE